MPMQTHAGVYRRRHYGKAPHQGPAWCTTCHAVRKTRRWSYDSLLPQEGAVAMICPGCQALAEKHYEGEVLLSAAWPQEKWAPVLDMMRHIEQHEVQKNPLSRIGDIDQSAGQMRIMTTTGFLARAIGRAIHKAFKGTAETHLAAGEDQTRVHWTA